MVVSNENIHAEKPVPDSSDNNGKMCTNAGRVQVSIDHQSGKSPFDSVVGSSNGNQMKLAPISNATKEMEYSPKMKDISFRHQPDSALEVKQVK